MIASSARERRTIVDGSVVSRTAGFRRSGTEPRSARFAATSRRFVLVGAAIVAGLAALSLYSVLRVAAGGRVGKTVVVHGRCFAGNVPTPERFHTAPFAVCHIESDRTANAYRFVADPDGTVQMQRFQRVHPPLIRDSFICDDESS